MDSKMIGFLGVDKYDLILYLSRILYQMHKKVLLIDCSQSKALTYSIPIPNQILCEESDSYVISYRGVDFTKNHILTKDLLKRYQEEYDLVIIDFGFNKDHELIQNCTHIVLVIDQKLHNWKGLKEVLIPKECQVFLVLYEIYGCKISLFYILEELLIAIPTDNIFEVSQECVDIKQSIDCQYNDIIRFHRLTKPYERLLYCLITSLYPDHNPKQKTKAYLKAKNGG